MKIMEILTESCLSIIQKGRNDMSDFRDYLEKSGEILIKDNIQCLQMNIGYACNLKCNHCHVEAGPDRQEKMSLTVIEDCLRFVERACVKVIDITGGAPEMNPNLHYLIRGLRELDSVGSILLRSNLTILDNAEYADLPEFLKENNVEIIASMPCYLEENVNSQRGQGVYHRNIRMLQKLNRLGYGGAGPNLHLVYNPGGDFLPGPQQELEAAYKEKLGEEFGITFSSLYTITNVPIGRFRTELEKTGLLEAYMNLLTDNFNSANLAKVMCRNLVSVDWQGRMYDCDFNQALRLPIDVPRNYIGHVTAKDLIGLPVKMGQHCFACVAGTGSSCQGSLSNKAV
jgi:radical SAM/Cys-rich protein